MGDPGWRLSIVDAAAAIFEKKVHDVLNSNTHYRSSAHPIALWALRQWGGRDVVPYNTMSPFLRLPLPCFCHTVSFPPSLPFHFSIETYYADK